MNDETYNSIFTFLIVLLVILGIVMVADRHVIGAEMSCESNSMYPVLTCGDEIDLEHITEFYEGEIYYYENPKNTSQKIAHRLVKDCRQGCYGLIFKGDVNTKADPIINESYVKYRISGVKYG